MPGFGQLNSATKYPSIETYHTIDPTDGRLLEEATDFVGDVIATEKVDGTSGRVIVMPDGDWFIGSREEILYASGDRIENPALSIVPTLLEVVSGILGRERSGLGTPVVEVYFMEVYGYRIGGSAKQYTKTPGTTGCRLFDIARIPMSLLEMPRDAIARWRDRGGQRWEGERELQRAALETGIKIAPRLGTVYAGDLPSTLEDMQDFLLELAPETMVAIDPEHEGKAEGIVLRTEDRSIIRKARFQDYERTRNPQGKSKGKSKGK
jgi:hypothetical protein